MSIPRSGHHLLEQLVVNYFDPQIYCDYYACCREVPCRYQKPFSKHHDLSLELAIEQDTQYLVQFRKEVQAQFEAYFRFFEVQYASGERQFDVQAHFPYFRNYYSKYVKRYQVSGEMADRLSAYHQFVLDHRPWYLAFVEKWILEKKENVYFLSYEDLVNAPSTQLDRVVRMLIGRSPLQFWKVKKIIAKQNINFKSILKDSDLYRPDFCEYFDLVDIQSLLLQR